MPKESAATIRRKQIRADNWPNEELWTGIKREKGWFGAPRTLPLILSLLNSKAVSQSQELSSVYLELFSRQWPEGIVEMVNEAEHAFAAGYEGQRAVRTWRERMATLEKTGFIRFVGAGNQRYKYVALVHPTVAVQALKEAGKISASWWSAYTARKGETAEASYSDLIQARMVITNDDDDDDSDDVPNQKKPALRPRKKLRRKAS